MKLKFLKNKLSILALILLINHSNLLAQNNNVEKTNNSAEIKQNNLVNQNNKSINNDLKNNKIIDKKVKKTPKKTLNKKNIKKKTKINSNKNKITNLEDNLSSNIKDQQAEVSKNSIANSIANYQSEMIDFSKNLPFNYIIEVELNENCFDILGIECNKSDKFLEDEYFHPTSLFIFQNKVIAIQYYKNPNFSKKYYKVRDGNYNLVTKNGNKINIQTKNGILNGSILQEGNIDNESLISSKCDYSEKLLAFHNLYKIDDVKKQIVYYSYGNRAHGLVELSIFTTKFEPQNYYAVIKLPSSLEKPVQNLNLCKMKDNEALIDRNFTKSECMRKFRCIEKKQRSEQENQYYNDVHANNFSYFDSYKFSKFMDIDPKDKAPIKDEQLQENLLSKENCFDDKNVDARECSVSQDCDDYIVIENCEVNYNFDKENLKF